MGPDSGSWALLFSSPPQPGPHYDLLQDSPRNPNFEPLLGYSNFSGKHRAREPRTLTPRVGPGPRVCPRVGTRKCPRGCPRGCPTNVHSPVSALQGFPAEGPAKRPTRESTEVPRQVSTKKSELNGSGPIPKNPI